MGKIDRESILENCRKRLEKDGAVATGIGIFGAVIIDGKILLRKRVEKKSLYNKNLSGKWELPGGGVELLDFPSDPSDCQKVIATLIARELDEETGLTLKEFNMLLIPAWLFKGEVIDLAFVLPIVKISETERSKKILMNKEIAWFSVSQLDKIDIVSPRMRFLIQQAINWRFTHWQYVPNDFPPSTGDGY